MKKLTIKIFITTFIFCFFTLVCNAQETSLEKSIFGVQIGYLGVWVNNETKLSNQIVVRSEIGLGSGIFGSEIGVTYGIFDGFYYGGEFILSPMLSVEPRWYYNLNKRNSNSKDSTNNSGNFLSVKANYNFNNFVIPVDQYINISQISLLINWGIRRNIGNNFNFESGLGVGYLFSDDRAVINLHLRLGYVFKKKKK